MPDITTGLHVSDVIDKPKGYGLLEESCSSRERHSDRDLNISRPIEDCGNWSQAIDMVKVVNTSAIIDLNRELPYSRFTTYCSTGERDDPETV